GNQPVNGSGMMDGPGLPREIDVGRLLERIRSEVTGPSGPAPDLGRDDEQVEFHLALAEENANVGTRAPTLSRYRGFKQRAARLVARGVMFLSRFLTNVQRQFNVAAVNCLRGLWTRNQRLEISVRDHDKRLARLAARMRAQERRIRRLLEESRSR